MQDDLKAYLQKRVQELDLERADALAKIQSILAKKYPIKVRAVSINDGVLKLVTSSAAVAGDLRLNQISLIKQFEEAIAFKYPLTRLLIQIRD